MLYLSFFLVIFVKKTNTYYKMALSTLNFSTDFRYDLATKQLEIIDLTDYPANGVSDANVTVVIKAETASGGIFYNNVNHAAPDIDPDVSTTNAITIPLPLSGGLPLQDSYTITLEYKDTTGAPYTVTEAKSFTLNYASPTVDLSMDVDCITPRLTVTDNTNYTVNNVAPSVVRAMAIHYPPSVPTADVTGTGSTLYTATFYTVANSTVEHSSSLTSTLSYDYGSEFYVTDSVTGSEVVQVSCSGDLCDIYCCIKSQWDRYMAVKGKNSVLEQSELAIFYKITSLAEMVGMALKCGKSTHISGYVTEILKLANCDAGCSCTDGTPQLVTGLGAGNSDVTVAAGTGVSVNLAGSEYTVSLTTANIAKLAATYNTVVAAGTNISSVSSASVTSGNVTTTTYTVNATDTITEGLYVELLVTPSPGGLPSYSIVNQKEYGTTFGTLTDSGLSEFLSIQNIGSAADWQNNYVDFKFQNFFSGGAVAYYPELAMIKEYPVFKSGIESASAILSSTKRFIPDIYSKSASTFSVRMINSTSRPSLGSEIDSSSSQFTLIIKIQA